MDNIRNHWSQALLLLCLVLVAGQAIGLTSLRVSQGSPDACPEDAIPGRQIELFTPRHHWIWLSCAKATDL